jgi:hypothetical protein
LELPRVEVYDKVILDFVFLDFEWRGEWMSAGAAYLGCVYRGLGWFIFLKKTFMDHAEDF